MKRTVKDEKSYHKLMKLNDEVLEALEDGELPDEEYFSNIFYISPKQYFIDQFIDTLNGGRGFICQSINIDETNDEIPVDWYTSLSCNCYGGEDFEFDFRMKFAGVCFEDWFDDSEDIPDEYIAFINEARKISLRIRAYFQHPVEVFNALSHVIFDARNMVYKLYGEIVEGRKVNHQPARDLTVQNLIEMAYGDIGYKLTIGEAFDSIGAKSE